MQATRRTGFTDSALVRVLARLTDADVPESRKSFSDQLSHWLGWKDAIALYAALDGGPTTVPPGVPASASAEESEFTRVRTTLMNAIAEDGILMRSEPADTATATATDFAPHRRRYLARQQTMAARIASLRQRLRSKLEAGSPAMAQLAAVDAVMEQALGAHEQRLLATVPAMLEKHFKRLREANAGPVASDADQATGESDSQVQPGAWLDLFNRDVQAVSLAELETRLQPAEGLLEALRKNQAKTQ